MKWILILATGLSFGTSALAYKEGTYTCKNGGGLPDNVYKIANQNIGGASLPFMEVHNFYKNTDGKVTEAVISGLASVSRVPSENRETLMVAYLRFEFDGDELYGCHH